MGETLSEPVFDRNATLAVVEGDIELLSEVVELFFEDSPGMLSEIQGQRTYTLTILVGPSRL